MFYCPFCKKRLLFCGTDWDDEVNEYLCSECNKEFEQTFMVDEEQGRIYCHSKPYTLDDDGNEIEALSMVVE